MCLEDLRLGRGRKARATIQVTSAANVTLNPDFSRVALLITLAGDPAQSDAMDVFLGTEQTTAPFFTLRAVQTMFLLRVEDLGQLVTGPFIFQLDNSSANASASITEIYTEVNAPPLDTYKP